ncbi:YihY/virulence factor BrkB family protein [bacterium]|nr:YihY/virulence factor BrkB family protein [bacterium]
MNAKKILLRKYELIKMLLTRIIDDGLLKDAANLTFISIVAIIPMLSFSLLILPNILDVDKSVYITRLLNNFIPETASKVQEMIELALDKKIRLNIFSFIFVGISSFSMFNILNKTFDRILRIHHSHKNDILTKITKFIGSIFFGFIIMILIFTLVSTSIIHNIPVISAIAKLLSYFVPIILQFVLLNILYLFMPSIRISRVNLMKGTLITVLIWYLAKIGFDVYINHSIRFNQDFGVLTAIPITVLWLYLNWFLILCGMLIISLFRESVSGKAVKFSAKKKYRNLQLDIRLLINSKEYSEVKSDLDKSQFNAILDVLKTVVNKEKIDGENDEKKSSN